LILGISKQMIEDWNVDAACHELQGNSDLKLERATKIISFHWKSILRLMK